MTILQRGNRLSITATTWLTKGGNPAEIARRLGNSVEVLMSTYVNFIEGDDDRLNSILQASIDQAN
ncbi:MAG: hypothetical protein EBU96_10190 [Actinobacteria bacterium]|nr:hypothetical protein [Actinomycetota bacterium]